MYSFSKSRNRKISLPAAVKSPWSESSRSRNRLISLWHVWNGTQNTNKSHKRIKMHIFGFNYFLEIRQIVRQRNAEWTVVARPKKKKREATQAIILTTFCRNRSSLSHFNRVTSCFRPSICIVVSGGTIILFDATTPSKHNEHAFVVASADDIDSKPVSLST